MPGVHKVDLIGQEVVAEHLGVSSQAISNWYARELPGMPTPTLVQYKPGKKPTKVWRRAQLAVWQKWHDAHIAERGQHVPKRNRKGQDDGPGNPVEDRPGTPMENQAPEGGSTPEAQRHDPDPAQGSPGTSDRAEALAHV